jgi:hypothetical protein
MSVVEAPCTTTSDVLLRAADLLGEWDWGQGRARCGDAICADGAIYMAVTGRLPHGEYVEGPDEDETPHEFFRASKAVANYLGVKGLFYWNDEPGRTKAEVIAVLREVAGQTKGDA